MRRVVTFAVALGLAFMAMGGIAPSRPASGQRAASARLTAQVSYARAKPYGTGAERRRASVRHLRHSPERRRHSPERRRHSPERRRHSQERRRHSQERRRHSGLKSVQFDGYTIKVPAGWPVYRLDRDPARCVRYDRHAVYLGRPGVNQQCPAHLVGRTATISLQAAGSAGSAGSAVPAFGGPAVESLPRVGAAVLGDSQDQEVRASITGPGLSITATYPGDAHGVLSIIRSVRRADSAARSAHGAARPRAGARAARRAGPWRHPAQVMARSAAVLPAGRGTGHHRRRHAAHRAPRDMTALRGFDSCTAPSLAAMRAWRRAFSAAAIYIGGAEAGCASGNLSASWVRSVTSMGWALMPTYVGPQASCSSFSVRISPARAAAQGRAAATDAIRQATVLGLHRGAPIYYDLEAYNGHRKRCRDAALLFLDAWTRTLHANGYSSGVYSSASSGAENVGAIRSVNGHRLAKPDSVWFGLWDDQRNVAGFPYLLRTWWPGPHRIKQYQGPHQRTVGGITLDIDSDWVRGAVYRLASLVRCPAQAR